MLRPFPLGSSLSGSLLLASIAAVSLLCFPACGAESGPGPASGSTGTPATSSSEAAQKTQASGTSKAQNAAAKAKLKNTPDEKTANAGAGLLDAEQRAALLARSSFKPPSANGEAAKPLTEGKVENPYATGSLETVSNGFLVRRPGQERFEFFSWLGERSLNWELTRMMRKEGDCEIRILPGRYVIEQRIFVNEVNNLTITGGPGVEFVFADGPDMTTTTVASIAKGDLTLKVAHPERMRKGFHYQLYQPDWRNDRQLEFQCKDIKDGVIHLQRPVHFMPHIKNDIKPGSIVMEEVNFFRVRRSPNFTLQGIAFDGRQRGGTRTHTTYCGVYATGNYKSHERATTHGLTIRNCSFKNLKGRGTVFYGMDEVLIEGNYYENIRAQAIEIDHFSSGHIKGNVVNGAEVGVMVNDAYESIVEGNVLTHCSHGVRFLEVYKDEWVNSGNIIRDNIFGPGTRAGVFFFNEGMTDNVITGNFFEGVVDKFRVVNGEGNQVDFR